MSALRARDARLHFHVFSDIPQSLLVEALGPSGFTYHVLRMDVGLIQRTLLCEDLDGTAAALDALYPLDAAAVTALAGQLQALSCEWVLCDIAPVGLVAAREAGVPSVLIENFTWDWIYAGYASAAPAIARHAPYLKGLFDTAGLRITTAPACERVPGSHGVGTISRAPRQSAAVVRKMLGAEEDEPLLLFNLGLDDAMLALAEWPDALARVRMIVPVPDISAQSNAQLICIEAHGRFYYPDLMHACDGVVGKVGYSTVAEAYHAGVPYAYLSRSMFRESAPLKAFIDAEMPSVSLGADALTGEAWRKALPELMRLERRSRDVINGADETADAILAFVRE